MYPFASLPENLAAFCEALRTQHGFRIGPGELLDAARALDVVDLASEPSVRNALRPVLAGTLDEARAFDAAFTHFFFPAPSGVPQDQLRSATRGPGTDGGETAAAGAPHAPPSETDAVEPSGPGDGPLTPLESAHEERDDVVLVARSSYSPLDAEAAAAPELPRIEPPWRDAARSFVRQLHLGLSRRWRPAARGRRFDLRRTLRAGLQTGGDARSPRWLRRPRRAPRVVMLIDGSRSMSAYAGTMLEVAVALASATTRVEVFTFSTGLERVTNDVRRAAAGEARRLDRLHHAWAGGTAIGACLHQFLRRFGERMVGRDTLVIIASDGLDVGEPDLLRDAMRALRRRSAGVLWLNPLLDTEGYEPTAAGMRAARPYVTSFAFITDAPGLARLSRQLRVRA